MTADELARRVEELLGENARLKRELEAKTRIASRAVASYQQRALHMEIIRQQNEDLDRLASDLAKAKRAEEERARELEAAARLKSEFLANFSHEIRTPLNGIIGYCDLLTREEGARLTPHGRRDLSVVKANAKTLLSLINDILDLSKIEAGRVEIVRENVDVAEIVEECQATVREIVKGKDVALTSRIDERARVVFTDSLKLRQIVLNLLSNAAKFTETGEIAVEVAVRGHEMVVAVEDTGVGIPPDQLPHIFEKFRQVDGSSTRKVGGTGLGLAIVRELSRVLGGSVEVTSIVGRGSTFTVRLPGVVGVGPDGATVATASDEEESSSSPVAATVLVVDDDPLIQQIVRGQLESEGFRVVIASDGLAALRLAREIRPDALVLDIHLPRLDGWGVIAELKGDAQLANVPIVVLSVEEQRAKGFSLGISEYLTKPVDPDRLVRVVKKAVKPGTPVLVVDDDAESRELVSRSLRHAGFSTSEARDGEEALMHVRISRPGLVILDLVMPNVDGFEFLDRARDEGLSAPVIVLTGKELQPSEQQRLRDRLARVVAKGGTAVDRVVAEAKRLLVEQREVAAFRLPRILYVEDSAQNRDIVRRYLQTEFDVIEAEDGEFGVERARRDRPDLVLMDLSLPRLDGWEATRRIKADPTTASIPVIALTAHATREDQERAKSAGCIGYLTKPIARDDLIGAIRRHLGAERS